MAYAAYKEPPGSSLRKQAVNEVIDVTVASVDAYRVRRALASCEGVGVLRCEPLLHPGAAYSNAAVRVRLTVGRSGMPTWCMPSRPALKTARLAL